MRIEVRFTISLHSNPPAKESHIDLFIDSGSTPDVYHYYLPLSEFIRQGAQLEREKNAKPVVLSFRAGSWHRRMYMSFEGDISDKRGHLKILRTGKISILLPLLREYPRRNIQVLW